VKSSIVIVFSMLLFLTFSAPLVSAKVNIMPLGDSITRGGSSGVVDPDFFVSYRKALWDSLQAAGYEPDFVGSLTDGSATPGFDPNHEGHGGWRADQIAANVFNWLITNPANIVLLHIGTNDISGNNEDPMEVDDILDEIDRYETVFGENVWVILAYIVNRGCDPYLPPCPKSLETTLFNSDVRTLVVEPRVNMLDRIITADIETAAGIDYRRQPQGDMWDDIHPFQTGYAKMSDAWFSALLAILPVADAGSDQSVNEFDTVTLDASGSTDPKTGNLSYLWEQTAGTTVVLSDEQSAQPTFAAPDVGSVSETLTFKLTVTDEDGLESADAALVTVVEVGLSVFADVPPGYWAEEFIYKIYNAGITAGCSQNPLRYCPENRVTRAQMAIFIGRGKYGSSFTPPPATGIFGDVPVSYWAADWIEQFYNDGITSGCGQNPLRYCPESSVTRAQMAVFLLRAKHGSSYTPPPASGIFADVPVTYWVADWIEQLYQEGITAGCAQNPLRYCPESSVTRAQMAVFMMRTFGL